MKLLNILRAGVELLRTKVGSAADSGSPPILGASPGRKFKTAWYILPAFVIAAHFLKIDPELVKLTVYGMFLAVGGEGVADIVKRMRASKGNGTDGTG